MIVVATCDTRGCATITTTSLPLFIALEKTHAQRQIGQGSPAHTTLRWIAKTKEGVRKTRYPSQRADLDEVEAQWVVLRLVEHMMQVFYGFSGH